MWGRRNTLLFSGVLFIASAAASSFAPNLLWLMLLRTLVGFAVGFKVYPISSIYMNQQMEHLLWLMLLRTLVGFAVGFKATCPSHLQ